MRIGCIVRTDRSGLANQTMAAARHLNADVVVAIDMGHRSRGPQQGFPGALGLCPQPTCPDEDHAVNSDTPLNAFIDCDVVWTAETWYWLDLPSRLEALGVRSVATVNPELFKPFEHHRAKCVLPTDWRAGDLGLPVVPHPAPIRDVAELALDRLSRPAEPARRFLHVGAPAMRDRNGTKALLAACEVYDGPPIEVAHVGEVLERPIVEPRNPLVRWSNLAPVADWRDLYALGDVLILPRRYGGQSLPALEAAASAMPVVMPHLAPQTGWSGVDSSLDAGMPRTVAMKGGLFPVSMLEPASIARRMKEYATSAELMLHQRQAAHTWARSLEWDQVEPIWMEALS